MTDPTTKRCTKCQQTKNLTEFSGDKSISDGRRPDCKACFNAQRTDTVARPAGRPPRKSKPASFAARACAARNVSGRARSVRTAGVRTA